MLALLLIAGSLALSNFAASIGIGLSGVTTHLRVKVAIAFGLFEAGMPLLGLLLGRQSADLIGSHAHLVAGGLLFAIGVYAVAMSRRTKTGTSSVHEYGWTRLVVSAAALSIDNLIVGFALGAYKVPLALAAGIIAAASITFSLVGLELGQRLGRRAEDNSELLAGAVLIAVGAAIAAGVM